jgi:hypothetical protein
MALSMNSFWVRQLSRGHISLTSCCVSGEIRSANLIFSLGMVFLLKIRNIPAGNPQKAGNGGLLLKADPRAAPRG